MRLAAFVFPGQGAHRAGMASAWSAHPAYATFAEVGRAAGMPDLPRLADDAEACARTEVAHPAVFAAGIAAWRALDDAGVRADIVAGHSLGEVTAAVAAGVLGVVEGARLVAERGRAFRAACDATPGAMAAVLKLDLGEVDEIARATGSVVVANDNAPGQVVLAGRPDAVDAAGRACRERGGRVLQLPVEGAFHTSAMTPAVVRVSTELRRQQLRDPSVPLVRGATADLALSAAQVAHGLVDGILATVRWRDVQRVLADLGVDRLVDVGPGGVLRGLARRTIPTVEALSVDRPEAVAALLAAAAPGTPTERRRGVRTVRPVGVR